MHFYRDVDMPEKSRKALSTHLASEGETTQFPKFPG
jgi:hypothetical protein